MFFLELKQLKKVKGKVNPSSLPGKRSVQIYRKFYAEEKEISNGVLAISVYNLASQPYISLASLLCSQMRYILQDQISLHHLRNFIIQMSRECWWGCFSGNDSEKNRLASEGMDRLLDGCCWMNFHSFQPHECVFEVRIPKGYGAWWSADVTEFIGFLEPCT